MTGKRESISQTVRRILQESGLTQNAIAKAAGIDKAAVSRFLTGRVGLSLASVDKLAVALGWELVAKKPEAKRRPNRG